MAVSQVEPTLKPYNTYLPPLNSHRAPDGPLNSLGTVRKWMQLHRPDATDDRECGIPVHSEYPISRENEVLTGTL